MKETKKLVLILSHREELEALYASSLATWDTESIIYSKTSEIVAIDGQDSHILMLDISRPSKASFRLSIVIWLSGAGLAVGSSDGCPIGQSCEEQVRLVIVASHCELSIVDPWKWDQALI